MFSYALCVYGIVDSRTKYVDWYQQWMTLSVRTKPVSSCSMFNWACISLNAFYLVSSNSFQLNKQRMILMSDVRLGPQFQKNEDRLEISPAAAQNQQKKTLFDVILFVLRRLAVQYVHKYHFSTITLSNHLPPYHQIHLLSNTSHCYYYSVPIWTLYESIICHF